MLQFVDFADYRVFDTASIQTMVYVLKLPLSTSYELDYLKVERPDTSENELIQMLSSVGDASQSWSRSRIDPSWEEKPFSVVRIEIASVLEKVRNQPCEYLASSEIGNGIDVLQDFVTARHLPRLKHLETQVGDGIFVLSHTERVSVAITQHDDSKIRPYYTTRELGRYTADPNNQFWIIYADRQVREAVENYPGIKRHLAKYAAVITSVYKPYGLHRPRDEKFFLGQRILSVRKTRRPTFSFVDFPCYVSRAFLIIKPKKGRGSAKYLTGILNSQVIHFWLYHLGKKQGDQLQVDKEPLTSIPIRTINFDDPADAARHDQMVALVEQMLDLHKKLAAASIPADKTLYQRQIEATDRQIDALVYELYGLTEEEIAIVEG